MIDTHSLPSHHVHEGRSGATSFPELRFNRLTLPAQDCPNSYQRPEDVSLATATAATAAANHSNNNRKKNAFDRAMLRIIDQSEADHPHDVRARARIISGVFILRSLSFCLLSFLVRTLHPFILARGLMLSLLFQVVGAYCSRPCPMP
jgi:hypothetical protein